MDPVRLKEIAEIRVGCLFSAVTAACLPILAIGAAMLGLSVHGAIDQANANAATRQVDATVVSARVVDYVTAPIRGSGVPLGQRTPPGTSGTPLRVTPGTGQAAQRQTVTEFTPLIEFTYERNGVPETSDRLTPVGRPGPRAWAEGVVARFPPGTPVRVWLPDDPARPAFLEKGWNPLVYAGIGAGVGAIGFCAALMGVSGGWRWPGRVRFASWLVAVPLAGVVCWAAWHCLTVVPHAQIPAWMLGAGIGAFLAALLPFAGAAQAARIARAIERAGIE